MGYVTIDIEVTPSTTGNGPYKVNAIIRGVPTTFKYDKTASEEVSIDLQEWKDLKKALNALGARDDHDQEETQVKEFGKSLFQQVIRDGVYTLYRHGKDYSSRRGHILRLRLHLGLPELIELPWELLCEEGIFLSLTTASPRILITRCPMDIRPIRTIEHHLPLQIMVMAAEPKGYHADAKREKDLIKEKLGKVEDEGFVSLKEIQGTDAELENIYINKAVDMFHFIGHGSFNKVTQEGELILEDGHGNARNIRANRFSMSLPTSVKLVFLNACESARGNAHESFSSIAYILAKQGRVVIAMQFRISIKAAVRFASTFYAEIARGMPVDEAVAEARHRVFAMVDGVPLDWAAPVLYMKSDSGVLFEIKDPSPSNVAIDEDEKETPDGSPVNSEESDTPSPSEPVEKLPPSSQIELGSKPSQPIGSRASSRSIDFSQSFRNLKNYRQKHPRLSVIVPIVILLVLSPILVLRGVFPHNSPSDTNCHSNSVLYPPQDPSESPTHTFVNVPGIKDTKTDEKGDMIGLSAGSTIFDTTSPDNAQMQQGATALRNGDPGGAYSHFHAVSTTDPSNGEAQIYAEDFDVLSHKLNYIAVILGVTFASDRIGSAREMMQGTYLAQITYNRSAQQRNCPSLVVIIANSGTGHGNTTWVAQQILKLKKLTAIWWVW